MINIVDFLPESNQTLEETIQFGNEFGSIIKKIEEKLKEDPDIKDTIEEIIKGYNENKNQKIERIKKIDELAQIENDQLRYDHHFESLVDSIIDVPVIYYREKVMIDTEQPPANKSAEIPVNTTQNNLENTDFSKKNTQSTPNIVVTQDRKQQPKIQNINTQKPTSNPAAKERNRLNIQVQRRQQNAPIQIQKKK